MISSSNRILILGLILVYILTGCMVTQDSDGNGEGAAVVKTLPIPLEQATPFPTTDVIEAPPAIKDARLLVLEWPRKIRVGDADLIRLTLDVDEAGSVTPSAEIDGHEVKGQVVEIPNVYDTHHVVAGARLDIAALQVEPNTLIEQPLLKGERLDFYWSLTAREIGTYRGTVWLYLRFLPLNGGLETQKTLSAQAIEIRSVNFLGLGGEPARWLGTIGILVGGLLGWDDVLCLIKRGNNILRKGA